MLLRIIELAELDRVLVQLNVGLEDTPFALSARCEKEGGREEGRERVRLERNSESLGIHFFPAFSVRISHYNHA